MQNNKLITAASLLAAATLFHSTAAISAENDSTDPIIVTATRTAQTVDETLASVTVITRDDIEASHSNSVMELLQNRTVGIDVSRNGGPGSTTNVYLRGSESDHVLVLIDGVRVASLTTGTFNWASLSPDQIERIEVVRGPNSTLYGSEAIGGVIQIFTRKGKGMHASVTGGSYRTGNANIGAGGTLGQARVHINLSHEQADGFSSNNDTSSSYEDDNDGYRNDSITTGFSLPLSNSTNLGLNLFHSSGRNDYDSSGYVGAYAETSNSGGNLQLDWQTSDRWSQRFMLNTSQDSYKAHSKYPSTINTWRRGANWQNDVLLGENGLFTAGAEAQFDRATNEGKFSDETINRAGYLQYQWSGERFDLLLGGRRDNHSSYGTHDTGRLTLGSRIGEGRIYASYASAFKAPTFNELYYPGYGNADIKPEESISTELGYRIGGLQTSLYQTRVRNLIQSYPVTNVGRATLQGLEVEYRYNVGKWQLSHGLTVQRTKDEDTGDQLLRRAQKKMLFNASGPVSERARLGIEVNYTGPRMDYSSVELPSYTLLNLTGEYRLAKKWRLSGRIENLLDEDYQLANGYNTPGLSAYLTLAYQQ